MKLVTNRENDTLWIESFACKVIPNL